MASILAKAQNLGEQFSYTVGERRTMRLEERVTILCARALASHDETEVRGILAELRLVLHQHVEQLRIGLIAAFTSAETKQRSGMSHANMRPSRQKAPRL